MNQENKNIQSTEPAPNLKEGANTVQHSAWKRFLAKKWVFPAAYIAAAAIILTLMWVYQGAGNNLAVKSQPAKGASQQAAASSDANSQTSAVAANAKTDTMQWPVADASAVKVAKPFYDSTASSEDRQAAVVQFQDTFTPHVGVDLTEDNNQAFDVLAAAAGTVTRVDKDPLVGNLVEITSSNGDVEIYQSLDNVQINKGDQVQQGAVIAKAGRNELEKDMGVHLHFEVRQGTDHTPVNPLTLLQKATSTTSTSTNKTTVK